MVNFTSKSFARCSNFYYVSFPLPKVEPAISAHKVVFVGETLTKYVNAPLLGAVDNCTGKFLQEQGIVIATTHAL